jgi:hypothetical protein
MQTHVRFAQAKKDLAVLFESLSQETKETIVGLKGANKVSGRERDKLNKSSVVTPTGEAEILSNKQTKKQHQKNVENEEKNDVSIAPNHQAWWRLTVTCA